MKLYNVRIKHANGTLSVMSHRDRMAWTYRTAKKHAKDCIAMMVKGDRPDWVYVAVMED